MERSYADLFDDDLDVVADRLDTAIKSTADQLWELMAKNALNC
ncbi:MAG: hypothetical protein JWP55_1338 [Mycobacterium sp.]|jgi:hypothetical protein|nr:hypothetical protein [Mycobacterium sp.]